MAAPAQSGQLQLGRTGITGMGDKSYVFRFLMPPKQLTAHRACWASQSQASVVRHPARTVVFLHSDENLAFYRSPT